MNWTNFANSLKGIDRVVCDVIPVKDEYAMKIATPAFAIALVGFKYGVMPKQLEPIVHSSNLGETKKVFDNQNDIKRPYVLSRTHLVYDPGDKDNAFYIFEGTHENSGNKRPFYIKKRYFDLIPGCITALAAPEDLGAILFISTQSYGYILPYKPSQIERETVLDAAKLLRGM